MAQHFRNAQARSSSHSCQPYFYADGTGGIAPPGAVGCVICRIGGGSGTSSLRDRLAKALKAIGVARGHADRTATRLVLLDHLRQAKRPVAYRGILGRADRLTARLVGMRVWLVSGAVGLAALLEELA